MWYCYLDNKVLGPFTADQIEELPELHQGLFWGKHFHEWVTFSEWQKERLAVEEQSLQMAEKLNRVWYYRTPGEEKGPLSYQELIDSLSQEESLEEVKVWTEGYHDWVSVFEVYRILDDLGIGRRVHPRVPISGKVEVRDQSGTYTFDLVSLSEGGCGIRSGFEFPVGSELDLAIHSPALSSSVKVRGEVVYFDRRTFITGIKFINLSAETRAIIVSTVQEILRNLEY